MKIDEYRKVVHEDIAIACNVNSSAASDETKESNNGFIFTII